MRVLVANRGEIACRIMRTLHEMGEAAVAVYTPGDEDALHVAMADERIALPAALGARGYLDVGALVKAAQKGRATALHPGYGFLSQSPAFAAACAAASLIFVGPSPAAMAALGDKRRARRLASRCGVPVIPGIEACDTVAAAADAAAGLGFPVLIKAAAGGGGRGMRRVEEACELPAAFAAAAREAKHAFGDARLLLEKCIFPARHIEVQALADGRYAMALGERECSLQRRYQKIVEESPSPAMTLGLRRKLQDAAVRLLEACGYTNAATVEFLVDANGDFYFLEVNTRLQVEHPVTEMCRGIDLVALQLHLAQGGALARCRGFAPRGHAIEARLVAEDPAREFMPSTGEIVALQWPQGPGIRVDTGVEAGTQISSDYDGLLAKVVAWAPDREMCRRRLLAALDELMLVGVHTNQALLQNLLRSHAFGTGQTYTHTVCEAPWPMPAPPAAVLALAHGHLKQASGQVAVAPRARLWERLGPFRMGVCGA